MSKIEHKWKQVDPPPPLLKRKLDNLAGNGILREKFDNSSGGVRNENGAKKRKPTVAAASATSSVVSTSKKASTIYKKGDLINGRYRVVQLMGTGSFGEVYRVSDDLNRGQESALKVEKVDKVNFSLLKIENHIYEEIQGGPGIPRVRFFGSDKTTKVPILILEKLGPSLQDMLGKCGGKFSCITTSMLADQMIERVEYLHERSILHRDIKPENFLLGRRGPTKDTALSYWRRVLGAEVFLIDYGLAKHFRDSKLRHIRPANNGGNVTGTVRYTSIHSHSGGELSRRDDLESIAYVLVYFMKGKLPWQNQPGTNKKEKHAKICEIKMTTSPAELCKGLPPEFERCVDYCRRLAFEEVPDYAFLRSLFRKLITDCKENGTTLAYDWNLNKPSSSGAGASKSLIEH